MHKEFIVHHSMRGVEESGGGEINRSVARFNPRAAKREWRTWRGSTGGSGACSKVEEPVEGVVAADLWRSQRKRKEKLILKYIPVE